MGDSDDTPKDQGFLSQLKSFGGLRKTETVVTNRDGKKFVERRDESGAVTCESLGSLSAGFVVDTKPDKELHKVIEGLFVGSQDAAVNEEGLWANRITHILSVATGITLTHLPSITYQTIEILDLPETNFVSYLPQICQFISNALAQGSVLVHCNAGVSRSTTAVIGYLMTAKKLSFQEAYELVKKARPATQPNEGFKKQLLAYDEQLRQNMVHKLQTPWTLWLENKTNRQSYSESLRRLGTFSTIEGLWEHYAHLQRPSDVPIDHGYLCFRETAIPMWESFPSGACWRILVPKKSSILATLWEQLLFATVGEMFGTPNVVGVALNIRAQEDAISVWLKDSNVPENTFKVREKVVQLLNLDPEVSVEYKSWKNYTQ